MGQNEAERLVPCTYKTHDGNIHTHLLRKPVYGINLE